MATINGKSLKAFIESLLVAKANTLKVEISPSGDAWFNDEKNMSLVKSGVSDMNEGRVREYTIDDINSLI